MGAETMNHPDEVEEVLSLCDLPLDDSDDGNFPTQPRRSESESAPEFFEFFSDLGSQMCAAEDIFLCGKLVPFNEPPISSQTKPLQSSALSPLRKRSDSLPELQSGVKSNRFLRSSRSLDYQKLGRNYSSKTCPELGMERNPSVRSIGKSDVSPKKLVKPRWSVFMFGMVKFPPEMGLKDIKSRQFRRSPFVMFPPTDASKRFSGHRTPGKCSWSLLNALSCQDHSSVAATEPLCIRPE